MVRRALAAWLVSLAVASTVFANFTLWARAQLLNSEQFATTTTSVLDSSAVRDVLATRITDAIMLQVDPQFAAQRPVIERATADVIASPAFAEVFGAAVASAHESVFDDTDDGLAFDLAGVETQIRQTADELNPGLGALLPSAAQVGPVQLVDPGDLPGLSRYGGWARAAATLTVVLAIGLFAAAFVLSPNRAGTLIMGGVGVAIGAGITLATMSLGRAAVVSRVHDGASKSAVRTLIAAVTDDLRSRTILLIVLGLIAAGVGIVLTIARRAAWFANSGAAFAARGARPGRAPSAHQPGSGAPAPRPVGAAASGPTGAGGRGSRLWRGDSVALSREGWDAYEHQPAAPPTVTYRPPAAAAPQQPQQAPQYAQPQYAQPQPQYAQPQPQPQYAQPQPQQFGQPDLWAATTSSAGPPGQWLPPAPSPNPPPRPAPTSAHRAPIVPPAQRPRPGSGGTVGADQVIRDRLEGQQGSPPPGR